MTAKANIEAVLRTLGVRGVVITREEEDRVYGWDTEGRLLSHVVLHDWRVDSDFIARHHHGESVAAAYREPHAAPALQVCIHRIPPQEQDGYEYFVEIDLDFHAPNPRRPDSLLRHGFEVVRNAVMDSKTDQREIARRLLADRGISV